MAADRRDRRLQDHLHDQAEQRTALGWSWRLRVICAKRDGLYCRRYWTSPPLPPCSDCKRQGQRNDT